VQLIAVKTTGIHIGRQALVSLLSRASEARAQMIGLALVLSAYEERTGKHSWRATDPATSRYLLFLSECGYPLADVERRACGLDVAAPAAPPSDPEQCEPAKTDDDAYTDAAPVTQPIPAAVKADQPASHSDTQEPDEASGDETEPDELERLHAAELAA